MMRLEVLRLVRDARTRADERHVATENIEQLRQLVETRPAEPAAERGDDVVALELVEPGRLRRRLRVECVGDVLAMRFRRRVRPSSSGT